jgi:hypothetical protein
MKFSSETISILKNFASINQSILFRPGNKIRTMSPQKTIVASANISEEIPAQAGIYDLMKFLSVHSLYAEPSIEFHDKFLTIAEGKSKAKYVYADATMILSPPDKEIVLPSVDVAIDVSAESLSKVLKAASVFRLPEIAFVGQDGKIELRAIDNSNPTADSYGIELGETSSEFMIIFKIEYLNLLPLDYHVSVSSKGISKFESENVNYFIAVDSKSTFKKGS